MMDEEDIIPVDQLAMDAATIVSETDASHSILSSGDEGDIDNWLSTRHTRNHNLQMNKINEEEDDDSDAELMKEDVAGPSDLYDNNLDDEDEAWVYKNLRSGQEKTVYVQRKQKQVDTTFENSEKQTDNDTTDVPIAKKMRSSGEQDTQMDDIQKDNNEEDKPSANDKQPQDPCSNPQLQQALLLKPRTSDAILSCPRCFNIVCMDCQQHEKYAGQFRAMFVMNIGVDWNKKIIYDEQVGELKLKLAASEGSAGVENDTAMQEGDNSGPDKIPHDNSSSEQHTNTTTKQENGELYYSVHCSYCQYEVAALDMKDEIYHFFGCLPSS